MFNLKYPIVQAPMAGGVVTPDMVSRVSNFGMLGCIPSGYLSIQEVESFIRDVKVGTSNSFALNILVNHNVNKFYELKKPEEIIKIEKKLGIHNEKKFSVPEQISALNLINIAIKYNVPFISTSFDLLNEEELKLIKKNNIKLIITVNTVEEAEYCLQSQSPSAVVFQTKLAGGHRGGFLNSEEYSDDILIEKFIKNNENIYFVKAGGVLIKRDVKYALNKGFSAVQIGTGFLMTRESAASDLHKQVILNANKKNQVNFTNKITGKLAKGIENKLFKIKNENNFDYPTLHYATSDIRKYAKLNNIKEYQAFWAGDSALRINSVVSLDSYMRSLV